MDNFKINPKALGWNKIESQEDLPEKKDTRYFWYDPKKDEIDFLSMSAMPPKFYSDTYSHWHMVFMPNKPGEEFISAPNEKVKK